MSWYLRRVLKEVTEHVQWTCGEKNSQAKKGKCKRPVFGMCLKRQWVAGGGRVSRGAPCRSPGRLEIFPQWDREPLGDHRRGVTPSELLFKRFISPLWEEQAVVGLRVELGDLIQVLWTWWGKPSHNQAFWAWFRAQNQDHVSLNILIHLKEEIGSPCSWGNWNSREHTALVRGAGRQGVFQWSYFDYFFVSRQGFPTCQVLWLP